MTDNSFVALDLASRGWPVFPCELKIGDDVVALEDVPEGAKVKKVPVGELVENGFKEATTNAKKIALWWRVRPDALVGIALPKGTMVVDVDEVEKFARAGLDLPKDAPVAPTLSGGFHVYLKTDGRPVRQTVKSIPGTDTRVGGRGYVIAWSPQAIPSLAAIPDAPEWVYDVSEGVIDGERPRAALAVVRRGRRDVEVATIKVGQRDNELARVAGSLRKAGLGPDAIYAAFSAMMANGQIESPREDPITDKDLRRIAGSIGTRQSDAVDRGHRPPPQRHLATDILAKDHGVLQYFVDELIPEGVGIIAGAPKIGKSWLVLQAAMEIAGGGELLDRSVFEPVPVLYYALEDGPRRAKDRMLELMGFHQIDVSLLEFRFEAPMLGDGLEDEVEQWLEDNEGGVVIVDVLAQVQPEQRSRGSAYNADYSDLKPMREMVKRLRLKSVNSAVMFVTHVRKQGAEDPYATVQGTTGITGSADWSWVIMRKRMEVKGTIQMTGRDIKKEPFIEAVFNGAWTAVGTTLRGGSKQRNTILEALLTEGDMTTAQVRQYVNDEVLTPDETPFTDNAVNEKLNAMKEAGLVEQTTKYVKGKGGGYVWHALDQEEIGAIMSEGKAVASAAEASSGHRRALPVRRVRGGARPAGARAHEGAPARGATPHAPQAPHLPLQPMEPVEGMDGSSRAPGRAAARAPAYTRAHSGYDASNDDGLEDITDLLEIKA